MKKYFSKLSITMIIIITLSTIIACSSGGGSSPPPEGQRVIGVSGGTVEGPTNINGTKIEVPGGALEEETTITITENPTPPEIEEDMISVGPAVELGPHKTKFKTAVTVTIPYLDEDDDGILDGTNIPEKNINPTVYNEKVEEWLRKKVISQDTVNNTVTFETNHFSTYKSQTYHKESDTATKDVIFTIDGLDIRKTLGVDFTGQRKSYLKRALLEGMALDQNEVEVVSYAGLKKLLFFIIFPGKIIPIYSSGDSWSGDANTTADILEDLIVRVSQEYQYAKRGGKKFILMGHSWGTTLLELAKMYATDSSGEQINPDLVLTLSAPRGSEKVSYDENHLFVEKELSLDKEIFIRSAIFIDMEEETPDPTSNDIDITKWAVSDAEAHISNYAQEWIAYCQKQQQDKGISPNLVPAKTHINYYSKGDIISGPLAGIIHPSVQDREVDNQDLSERRNAESMEIFHAITSLDDGPDGAWQDFLSDDPTYLSVAKSFREIVKCDILNILDGTPECYEKEDEIVLHPVTPPPVVPPVVDPPPVVPPVVDPPPVVPPVVDPPPVVQPPTCTDADADGYYTESGCGTTIDCNDNNNTIHPGITEVCCDGIDNDCDGTIDIGENCSSGSRFIDMGDGTVRDNSTNLIWLKDSNPFGKETLSRATKLVGDLCSGEHGLSDGSVAGDWRLPTIAELQKIGTNPPITWGQGCPTAIWTTPCAPFIGTANSTWTYWSSTYISQYRILGLGLDDGCTGWGTPADYHYAWFTWPVRDPK